jgi:hypothetical protein
MDVAAESIPQDATSFDQAQKFGGEFSGQEIGHTEDNKFQKAIAAWRSA